MELPFFCLSINIVEDFFGDLLGRKSLHDGEWLHEGIYEPIAIPMLESSLLKNRPSFLVAEFF